MNQNGNLRHVHMAFNNDWTSKMNLQNQNPQHLSGSNLPSPVDCPTLQAGLWPGGFKIQASFTQGVWIDHEIMLEMCLNVIGMQRIVCITSYSCLLMFILNMLRKTVIGPIIIKNLYNPIILWSLYIIRSDHYHYHFKSYHIISHMIAYHESIDCDSTGSACYQYLVIIIIWM